MRSFGLAHNEGFKGFSYYLIMLIRVFRLLSHYVFVQEAGKQDHSQFTEKNFSTPNQIFTHSSLSPSFTPSNLLIYHTNES